ncbi:MAG: EAL domain-containing protein [Oscillospiraceae bacterium]
MTKSVTFDIAALILLAVIFYTAISRRKTKGTSYKVYILMVVTAIVANAFDVLAVTLDNEQVQNAPLLYFAHSFYLLFHNLSVPLYLFYVVSLSDTWHTLTKHKGTLIMICAPFALVVAALVVNPFTGWLFNFGTGTMTYTRGPLFVLMYFCTIWYSVYVVCYIVKYRKSIGNSIVTALLAVIPLALATMLVQFLYPKYVLEMFAGAIGLLFITMSIQRPEDVIDPVTGLRRFSSYAENMRRAFTNGKSFSVILICISNFRSVGTMLGYEVTNELLSAVGERIIKADAEAHTNADNYNRERGQYSVVLSRRKNVEELAEKLNRELSRGFEINGSEVKLLPKICIVNCPEDIPDFRSLMAFEDDLSEAVEVTGEVVKASDVYHEKRCTLMRELDDIIERALANHSFQVYYQPIYSVSENRFTSAEALLRLIDPEHGFISPDLFIPAAEKSGAIHRIGEYVLEEVCAFIGSDEFRKLNLDYIEINLSVAQCMKSDLADKVLEIMQRYNVTSDRINLEITETASGLSQCAMASNLQKLCAAGISFSLDDYGTGYSNMKRVISLPLKIVKLDKSFADEQNNPKMWIVLQNTVRMLKDMNMEIVVEGIETQTMVQRFSNLKCDFIQGYYFSKPIPKADFVAFILNANQPTI